MTNKDIAERLRKLPTSLGSPPLTEAIERLANELDPPKPEPGTFVWWRVHYGHNWHPGIVCPNDTGELCIQGAIGLEEMSGVSWKPARILAPDEMTVKIPPVKKWPISAAAIYTHFVDDTKRNVGEIGCVITHAGAERTEASQ